MTQQSSGFKPNIDEAGQADLDAILSGLLDRYLKVLEGAPGVSKPEDAIRTAAAAAVYDVAREAQRRLLRLNMSEEHRIAAICALAEVMAAVAGFQLSTMPLLLRIVANVKLGQAVEKGLVGSPAPGGRS